MVGAGSSRFLDIYGKSGRLTTNKNSYDNSRTCVTAVPFDHSPRVSQTGRRTDRQADMTIAATQIRLTLFTSVPIERDLNVRT